MVNRSTLGLVLGALALPLFCLDGTRHIQTSTGSDSIGTFAEYHTMPDSFTKILGYGAPGPSGFVPIYFVAYLANGMIVEYGKSINARVVWRGGIIHAWHEELDLNRRGNTIRYRYAALNGGGKSTTTRESVIDTIIYAGFIDTNGVETLGNAVVDFEYDSDDRHGKLFYEGEEVTTDNKLARCWKNKTGRQIWPQGRTCDEVDVHEVLGLDRCNRRVFGKPRLVAVVSGHGLAAIAIRVASSFSTTRRLAFRASPITSRKRGRNSWEIPTERLPRSNCGRYTRKSMRVSPIG